MSEGREIGGPNGSGGPRRRGVFLVRRVVVGLALLVLMVLIAPQAYQALVGSGSDTQQQAPPPEAENGENLGAAEPVAEPAPPAEAPEEPVEKNTAVKPPEDAPKDEKPAPEEEPTPSEPEAEVAAAAVLVSEQQYSSVAGYDAEPPAAVEQYSVDAQYASTEQYLLAGQPSSVLPETVVSEAVAPEPADVAVQNAQEPAGDLSAVQAPAPTPVPVEPVAVAPVTVEPVALELFAVEPVAVDPVAAQTQYAPVVAPVTFEAQYAPAAAPVAPGDVFAVPAAPVVEEAQVTQVYSTTETVYEYQAGDGTANAVAYSSAVAER